MTDATAKSKKSQLDKFKLAAKGLECDDDEKRFAEKLGRLVKSKSVKEK